MLVRLDFQKESNNLGLINIFPEVSKCLPIRTLRFSEQNSEILKYYLFSIKKNFFFILEGSWRAKLLFDRPVHGLRPREANSLAQDRRDGSWHAAPAPSWMGPAGSQPCTPGTAVLCQHTQQAGCEHQAPPAQGVPSTHSSDWPNEAGTHAHSPVYWWEISQQALSPQPTVHELKEKSWRLTLAAASPETEL